MTDPKIGGMAAVPARYDQLGEVVERIAPQLDLLYVAVAPQYEEIVEGLLEGEENVHLSVTHERMDDARKFSPMDISRDVDEVPDDFYFFALDDDLLYPNGYVDRMVSWIDKWNREASVCVHGSWIDVFPCESYYKDKRAVHFSQQLTTPVQVLFPGTGTLAFHTDTHRPYLSEFPKKNIADAQYGVFANADSTPVLAVPRPQHWLQQHPDINALENSIWSRRRNDDNEETGLINRYEREFGWEFPPQPQMQE